VSSRSIGRGICPRCGREGTVYVRRIGNREYIYFKHGQKWCYIGPAGEVDVQSLVNNNVNNNIEQTSSEELSKTYINNIKHIFEIRSVRKIVPIIACVLVIITVALIIFHNYTVRASRVHYDLVKAKLDLKHCTLTIPIRLPNGTTMKKVFKIKAIKSWTNFNCSNTTLIQPYNQSIG